MVHIYFYGEEYRTDQCYLNLIGEMKRQETKKDQMAKLYRQFSKQFYQKLKHQFPRMRESEIISTIIKSWQDLGVNEKKEIMKQFQQNGVITKIDFTEETKKTKKTKGKINKQKKIQKPSTPVVVIHDEPQIKKDMSEDSDYHRQQSQPRNVGDSESQKSLVTKQKKIMKMSFKNRDYIQYFKHYYQKLRREHQRWNSVQISTIIKLMWRKRRQQKKTDKKINRKIITKGPSKILSGRMAFKRDKIRNNYTKLEADLLWKQQPKEGKEYWRIIGRGLSTIRRPIKTLLRCKPQIKPQDSKQKPENYDNVFSFMKKSVR